MAVRLLIEGAVLERDAFVAAVACHATDGRRVLGWALTPRRAAWVHLHDGDLSDSRGERAWLSDVFEIVLFDGTSEWRWLDDQGAPQAAWLREAGEDPAPAPEPWTRRVERETIDASEESLLLWGAPLGGAAAPAGWTTMSSARTGPFDVPGDFGRAAAACLVRKRYLGVSEGLDGNVELFATRWREVRAVASGVGESAADNDTAEAA